MLKDSRSFKISFSVVLSFAFVLFAFSVCFGTGMIANTEPQNLLSAPAVGQNVVAYIIGEYLEGIGTRFHLFVRRCECLKRVAYTDTGVFITYNYNLTLDELNAFTPQALIGLSDLDGQLASELSGSPGLVPVIERVLEYKKADPTMFVARVSIKFVSSAI